MACRMIWAAIGMAIGAAAIAQTEVAATKPSDFVYVAATSQDQVGRVMTPVFVNGVGPFAFVVDTGASSSVIAPRVARRLSLQIDATNTKLLRGITGSEVVPTVNVSSITAGGISIQNASLPVVEPRVFADADGIFGADAFGGGCLIVSFERAKVAILTKPCPRVDDNWEKVRVRTQFGGLVVTDVNIGATRAVAIIDTGAERSLGNPALLAALRERKKVSLDSNLTQVYAATSQIVFGDLLVTPSMRMGGVSVGRFQVVYGDFEVFKIWEVADRPAIVLGIDVLGQMDAMMIDYTRSELLMLPRNLASGVAMKRRSMPTRLPKN